MPGPIRETDLFGVVLQFQLLFRVLILYDLVIYFLAVLVLAPNLQPTAYNPGSTLQSKRAYIAVPNLLFNCVLT